MQDGGEMEIYFNKNEFNIGNPNTGESSSVHMRSETVMKLVYETLGRSPCPAELSDWKFRPSDFDDWEYDHEITVRMN